MLVARLARLRSGPVDAVSGRLYAQLPHQLLDLSGALQQVRFQLAHFQTLRVPADVWPIFNAIGRVDIYTTDVCPLSAAGARYAHHAQAPHQVEGWQV
jgi:hypothetical protein